MRSLLLLARPVLPLSLPFGLPLAAILTGGCATPDPYDTGIAPGHPGFDADVLPIMQQHCVRCHEDGGREDGGIAVDTWERAHSARVAIACASVGTDIADAYGEDLRTAYGPGTCEGLPQLTMPPGAMTKLTVAEQLVLVRWVADGGPE